MFKNIRLIKKNNNIHEFEQEKTCISKKHNKLITTKLTNIKTKQVRV